MSRSSPLLCKTIAGRASSLASSPDATRVAIGTAAGALELHASNGGRLWQGAAHTGRVDRIAWSPDATRLVTASSDGTVAVWEAGEVPAPSRSMSLAGTVALSWAPRGLCLAALEGGRVRFYDRLGEAQPVELDLGASSGCIEFSSDGDRLASGGHDGAVSLWPVGGGGARRLIGPRRSPVSVLRWAPYDEALAMASGRIVSVWGLDPDRHRFSKAFRARLTCMAWSPDRAFLACGCEDGIVSILSAGDGGESARRPTGAGATTCMEFSPDATSLIYACEDGSVWAWEVLGLAGAPLTRFDGALERYVARQAATLGRRPARREGAAPARVAATARDAPAPASPVVDAPTLVSALSRLLRLGLSPPLAVVDDLLGLTAGRPVDRSYERLEAHPGVKSLIALRWPTEARVGLVALLMHWVEFPGWEPPAGDPSLLGQRLRATLEGDAIARVRPTLPLAGLLSAADRLVDHRVAALLTLIGPEAVADDPGLPLKLIGHASSLPMLSPAQRRLLGRRLPLSGQDRADGRGPGDDLGGLDRRGDLRSILPRELALPRRLFAYRYRSRALLYRMKQGDDLPRLRPTVLVLDVSPPSFGPVESVTRLGAHLAARALRRSNRRAGLVLAGTPGAALGLDRAADLLEIWTARSLDPADEARSLRLADRMRRSIRDGERDPIILLLAHEWFGADVDLAVLPGLRALFVTYPGGRPRRPPLARRCERWSTISPAGIEGLPRLLAELLT